MLWSRSPDRRFRALGVKLERGTLVARLEVYVPKSKREYGHYVLPMLRGDRVVGRIEPVHDRKAGVLRVHGVWWEDGVRPVSQDAPLRRLARWLGATIA